MDFDIFYRVLLQFLRWSRMCVVASRRNNKPKSFPRIFDGNADIHDVFVFKIP